MTPLGNWQKEWSYFFFKRLRWVLVACCEQRPTSSSHHSTTKWQLHLSVCTVSSNQTLMYRRTDG